MEIESSKWTYQVKVMVLGEDAKSKEERRLVRKLDLFVLTYCCFSYFVNYLDRAAFANAYVAGLKEDIGLHGSQYNVLLSMMTAGYVLAQIPHGIAIQKIAPRIWLPSMVLLWAGLTMCTAACKTYEQMCVVRFFQGMAEASTYCGTMYIMGSWYKPLEIAKRTAIFTAVGQAGSMFAGVMMTAVHKSMNGYGGLPGWKWVFLIDGIITLPVAAAGFVCFPDIPEQTKAHLFSLKEDDIKLAIKRLPPKREDAHNVSPLSLAKRILGKPYFYVLGVFSIVTGALEAFCVQSLFLLWMKFHSDRYTSSQITTYPLGVQAVAIVSNIGAAIYMDSTGHRLPIGFLACGLQLISAVLILIPTIPDAATFFAYYLAGTSYMVNPLLFGWANIILKRSGDEAARSVLLYWLNAIQSTLYTFWGIALYPANEAPYWRKGGITMCVVVVLMAGLMWAMKWLDRKSLSEQLVEDGDSAAEVSRSSDAGSQK
ncbi:major facilitator superfamily transporter [Colletotrichum gloeosporioides Cg-14]|uniref:Major facilitator superfamily transporter n=1 Tax=Colletotrichum gloeosporioides (strain Cg-14) TaxID=1237896 RepID=T0KDS5_COLGC|nr:major facilitator superfamily transporter [Colletotrichum gloeosporioides Cg-14]